MKSLPTLAFVVSLAVLAGAPVLVRAQTGVAVPTVQIGARAVNAGYEIDGVIEPVKQSTIAAQASGRVVRLRWTWPRRSTRPPRRARARPRPGRALRR
ncbi:MAG: hypothetical protein K2X75_10350 [Burkholderiaceae bacterium]|nr:hypothetical protein [Burkholderiaceae bacterium]